MEFLMAIALLCQVSPGYDGSSSSFNNVRDKQIECQKRLIKCVDEVEGPFTKELKLSDCIKKGSHQ